MASQEQFMVTMFKAVPSIVVMVAMFEVIVMDEWAGQISFPNHYPIVDSKFDQDQNQEAFQVILHLDFTINSKFNQDQSQAAFRAIRDPILHLIDPTWLKVGFRAVITIEIS